MDYFQFEELRNQLIAINRNLKKLIKLLNASLITKDVNPICTCDWRYDDGTAKIHCPVHDPPEDR